MFDIHHETMKKSHENDNAVMFCSRKSACRDCRTGLKCHMTIQIKSIRYEHWPVSPLSCLGVEHSTALLKCHVIPAESVMMRAVVYKMD
jgi:hypothetical protein